MQRRQAITQLATMLTLPAWAQNWRQDPLSKPTFFTISDSETLAEIVETIIPQTDTPGAKSLGVHTLIERIVKDCYDKPSQDLFSKGISQINAFSQKKYAKTFAEAIPEQRLATLLEMSTSNETKAFYNMVRQMTIRSYTNSEFYLTKIVKYEFAPARFYGCVSIKQK